MKNKVSEVFDLEKVNASLRNLCDDDGCDLRCGYSDDPQPCNNEDDDCEVIVYCGSKDDEPSDDEDDD